MNKQLLIIAIIAMVLIVFFVYTEKKTIFNFKYEKNKRSEKYQNTREIKKIIKHIYKDGPRKNMSVYVTAKNNVLFTTPKLETIHTDPFKSPDAELKIIDISSGIYQLKYDNKYVMPTVVNGKYVPFASVTDYDPAKLNETLVYYKDSKLSFKTTIIINGNKNEKHHYFSIGPYGYIYLIDDITKASNFIIADETI